MTESYWYALSYKGDWVPALHEDEDPDIDLRLNVCCWTKEICENYIMEVLLQAGMRSDVN